VRAFFYVNTVTGAPSRFLRVYGILI